MLILLAGMLSVSLSAQTSAQKDSLLAAYKMAKDDTSKIRLILLIQKIYATSNFDSSFYFLNQASALAAKLKTDKFEYTINNKFSIYYYFNSNFEKSIEYAMKAKSIAEKQNDLTLLARSYNNISGIYNHFNRPKNAIEFTLKGLEYAEKAKDSTTFASYNISASETYGQLRQFDKALVYAKRGIEFGKKFDDIGSVIIGLNNLSVFYSQLNKLDSAVLANEEQLKLAKENQNIVYLNYALINLCYNNFRNGNLSAVKKYADELVVQIQDYPDKQLTTEANVAFAFSLIGQQKYAKAAAELEKGIKIAAADNNTISLENLYKACAVNYYLQGKIKEAELYTFKTDSVLRVRNLDELNLYEQDLATKYETEKKEAQIKLQQAQLNQKSLLNYVLIAGAIALLLILLLSYRNYKHRQKLQQVKIDELEKEKLLTATEAVLKGEEQERSRLAKDLHDGLGGMLSGIKYSLNNMKGNLIMTPDNALAFERSIDMLDSSIREMRRVSHNMMPEVLVKYGLDIALKEFCNEIDRSGVMHISYHSMWMEKITIDQTTAITLYRIVQELVNNAIKHSGGKNVLVQLHYATQEHLLTITVEDDGNGFDIANLKQQSGIGWSNIENRVQFLKGKLDIQSEANKGTSVLIEIAI